MHIKIPVAGFIVLTLFIHLGYAQVDEVLVDAQKFIPGLKLDIRYASANNVVGRSIKGYEIARCYLTPEATKALKGVAESVAVDGYGLKVFDCYSPQRAVDDFIAWAKDSKDQVGKANYYPSVDKSLLVKKGYIAAKLSHSRGSSVDLTLINRKTGKTLDMGTTHDFFDAKAHTNSQLITPLQRKNRAYLLRVMENHGFKNLPVEWWHFTLKDEPYKKQTFDFPIK